MMSKDKVELYEWINTEYSKMEEYINLSSKENTEFNYFSTIGMSLTIFSIFETSMNYLFSDFVKMYLEDENKILNQLPMNIVKKIFNDDNMSKKYTFEDKLHFLHFNIFNNSNYKSENNPVTRYFKDQLESTFRYIHINNKEGDPSSKNSIEIMNTLFYKGNLSEKNNNSWFSDLTIQIPQNEDNIIPGVENFVSENAVSYLKNYSSKIRHVIAHTLPDYDAEDSEFDLEYLKNKSKYSPSVAVKIFRNILIEMCANYEKIHNRKVFINTTSSLTKLL